SREQVRFTNGDTSLAADHVNGVVDIALELGQTLAASDAYVGQLAKVCGAGSTRASLSNAACLDTFAAYYALKALRRPATSAELTDFKADYTQSGLALWIARLIAHPRFYYRFDNEGTKLSGQDGTDATYKLTKYELLSRITFLF